MSKQPDFPQNLRVEMHKWVHDELVSPAQAEQILERYPLNKTNSESGASTVVVRILSVIASLLIGLGIILIFAYNWDSLGKTAKLALSFLPLASSLALAAYTLARRSASSAWIESTGIAIALSSAACLGLVAQTLQLQSNLSQFYLTWQLSCIPLLFALRSRALYITLCTLTVFWTATSNSWGASTFAIRFLCVTLPLLAYLIHERRSQQSRLSAAFFTVSTIWCFSALTWEVFPYLPPAIGFLIASATFYLWLARTEYRPTDGPLFTVSEILCKLGLTTTAFILSFDELWRDRYYHVPENVLLAQLIAASVTIIYLVELSRQFRYSTWHDFVWTLLPIVVAILSFASDDIASLAMTPYILLMAIAAIHLGYKSDSITRLNHGLLIIVALAITRFFDSEYSLLIRGSAFIGMGLLFLFANMHFLKRRKELRHARA